MPRATTVRGRLRKISKITTKRNKAIKRAIKKGRRR